MTRHFDYDDDARGEWESLQLQILVENDLGCLDELLGEDATEFMEYLRLGELADAGELFNRAWAHYLEQFNELP